MNRFLLIGTIGTITLSGLFLTASNAKANRPPGNYDVVQSLTAPGGRATYYILEFRRTDTTGSPEMDIEVGRNDNQAFEVLVQDHPSDDPSLNLTGFSRLYLSPDSRTLYFESSAWAVEDAIHALDIATRRIRLITSGELACVVLGGEFQGDLVVQQHRYFVQGGSYDALYLFTPTGKDLGMVSQDTDATHVCPML